MRRLLNDVNWRSEKSGAAAPFWERKLHEFAKSEPLCVLTGVKMKEYPAN
jgi:hypothetical protein